MRVTYSPIGDMGYLYLADDIGPGGVDHTEPLIVDLPSGTRHLINLDFDASGRLVGIEFDGATATLPTAVLEAAQVLPGTPIPLRDLLPGRDAE